MVLGGGRLLMSEVPLQVNLLRTLHTLALLGALSAQTPTLQPFHTDHCNNHPQRHRTSHLTAEIKLSKTPLYSNKIPLQSNLPWGCKAPAKI